ncbi:MAG: hypothetical protein GXP35_09165, partial [Actinobacteria bacterium]|nr:hypothetical protein [Actinomycetota bacterium]
MTAAVVFGLVRPNLTDVYPTGFQGRLHWPSTGFVLWGIATLVVSRLDLSARSPRQLVRIGLAFAFPVLLTALLFRYPADVDRVAATIWTVVLAVGIIGGVWIALNLLVDQAKSNWQLFTSLLAALVAGLFFAVLRGNLSLFALFAERDPLVLFSGSGRLGHLEWPVTGALLWGGAVWAITTLGKGTPRILVGAGAGLVTGWLIGGHVKPWLRPQLDWFEIVLFTLVFAGIGAALKSRSRNWIPGVALGAGFGWMWATWFTSSFGGSEADAR